MPITNHIIESSVQANGGTHNVLRMFDQDGQQYMVSFFLPSGVDVAPVVSNRITQMDEQLAAMEFEQIVGAEE